MTKLNLRILIGDGTTHDVKVVPDLINYMNLEETEILCTDKGYDSELLRMKLEAPKIKANSPKKCNSKSNNQHMDWYLYKIRNLVEKAFCRLKHFRGIST